MKVTKEVKTDNFDKLLKIIKELNRKVIKIGIFGKDDSEVLMIATVNEFGCNIDVTPKMRAWLHWKGLHLKKGTDQIVIPERPFIRGTYDNKKSEMDRFVTAQLDMLFHFELSIEQFFDKIGQYLAGLTQEYAVDLRTPPNHPFTLARKEPRTNPLVDSGEMINKITWKVEER